MFPLRKKSGLTLPLNTVIGSYARIDAKISLLGGLRIDGAVGGNISSVGDANDTPMISKSGQVTGASKTGHLVLGGHVDGPVEAAGSIAVLEDGRLPGDVSYKSISIHVGGVVADTFAGAPLPDSGREFSSNRA